MTIYRTIETDEELGFVTVDWSEKDILDFYWWFWLGQMEKANKIRGHSVEELKKMCIDDWVVVNWAYVVK